MKNKTEEIMVLVTGGTINMGEAPSGGGSVPSFGGAELIRCLPQSEISAMKVSVEEFCNVPSAYLSMEDLLELSKLVRQLASEKPYCGFVVTMGTDILEEAVYFMDLTAGSSVPLVMTGAMRASSHLGYDGYANLRDSLVTASSIDPNVTGAVLVFNEEIHAARDVQKSDASALGAFISPGWGPIGRIVEGEAWIRRAPLVRESFTQKLPLARVELIRCYAGMDRYLLDCIIDSSPGGLVVEAFGVGHVPVPVADALESAVRRGIPVVVSSRCLAGSVLTHTYGFPGSESDLKSRGVVMTRGLTGLKARIKLLLSLASGDGMEMIEQRFGSG